ACARVAAGARRGRGRARRLGAVRAASACGGRGAERAARRDERRGARVRPAAHPAAEGAPGGERGVPRPRLVGRGERRMSMPWRGRLFFGRTYEDAELDAALLPAGRTLCIAGAGETAFRLARDGREVVALDVNAEQIAYVRERVAGGPVR